MNLFDKLNSEMSAKHLTEFEKVRYIYLRTCEMFSFDSKWHFADLFDDYELLNFIAGRKFDIRDIDDTLVVCYSYSRYILQPLIREFTSIDTRLQLGKHCYVKASINDVNVNLDATMGDLAAVKVGIQTKGFDTPEMNYKDLLLNMDSELGYKYVDRKQILNSLEGLNSIEKMHNINNLLNNSKSKYHYSDAHFFLVWLISALNIRGGTYVNSDYQFHHLISIPDENAFFDMSKFDNEYAIKQINKDEYNELTRVLKHN